MPIVQVNMLEGRSVAQKRRMIAAVTDALVQSLEVPPESVRILIQELDPEHFAVAGTSAGEVPLGARCTSKGNGGVHPLNPAAVQTT